MGEQSPGNIFDEAGRKHQKSPLRKEKREKRLAKPISPSSKNKPVSADEDVLNMFKRMREIQDSINGKMLDIFEKSKLPQEKVEGFLKEPVGLPEQKKAQIDHEMQKLESEVKKTLGAKATTGAKQVQAKKEEIKRKKKFIGKRRNWLEM